MDRRSARATVRPWWRSAEISSGAALAVLGSIAGCGFNSHGTEPSGAGGTTTSAPTSGTTKTSSTTTATGGTGGAMSTSTATGGSGGGTTTGSGGAGGTGGKPPTGDMVVYYAHSGSAVTQARTWREAAGMWSEAEPTIGTVTTITWIATPEKIVGEEMLLVLASTGGGTSLDLLRKTPGGWTKDWSSNGIAAGNANRRGFDVELEASSGEALAVYSDGTPTPQWRTRSGGNWSAAAPIPSAGGAGGTVLWVDLVRRPGTDEMTLFFSDSAKRLVTVPWSGSAWGAATVLTDKLHTTEYLGFGAAYESVSGELIAIWGGPGAILGTYYGRKPPDGSWVISSQLPTPFVHPGPLRFVPEPGTDRIALAYVELTCGGKTCDDFVAAVWDGDKWADAKQLDGDIDLAYSANPGAVPVDVAWVGSTGQAVAVYTDTGNGLDWATWKPGGWTLQADAPTEPPLKQRVNVRAVSSPVKDEVMLLVSDSNGALYAKRYDGTAWSDVGPALDSTLSANAGSPLAVTLKP